MKISIALLLLVALWASLSQSQVTPNIPKLPQQFEADVVVSTSLTKLSLKGYLYYDYPNERQRFDSNLFGVAQTELDIFSNFTRYVFETGSGAKYCQKCALSTSLFPLFVEALSTFEGQTILDGLKVDVWTLEHPVFDLTMTWWVNSTGPAPSLVQANFTVGDVSTWIQFQNQNPVVPPASAFVPPSTCGPLTCNSPANMVFVLDGSGSIGNSDFQASKNFLISLVSSFTISPTETNVGVIQFADTPITEVSLSSSQSDVLATLQSMGELYGGSTDLAAAIKAAATMLQGSTRGVQNIMVLLTDGYTSPDPINNANAAKALGIEIFCVAIGSADVSVLQSIASTPSVDHFFDASSFDQLSTLLNAVVASTCSNYDCDASAPKSLEPFRSTWNRLLLKADELNL